MDLSGFVGDYADPFYFQIKKNVTAAELDAAGAERGDYGLMRSFRFQRGGGGLTGGLPRKRRDGDKLSYIEMRNYHPARIYRAIPRQPIGKRQRPSGKRRNRIKSYQFQAVYLKVEFHVEPWCPSGL